MYLLGEGTKTGHYSRKRKGGDHRWLQIVRSRKEGEFIYKTRKVLVYGWWLV